MASNVPPKKNTAWTVGVEVRSQLDPNSFQSAPTIAAGDFKISIDRSAYANLTNLPTASGTMITLVLTAAEMNGDEIKVQAFDVAGAQWAGRTWTFYTTANRIDDLASQLTTIAGYVDTEVLPASIRAALGLAAANLDTQLTAIAALDAAIKAKTDALIFTKALELDVNVQSINGVTVNGAGTIPSPWGP